MTEDGRQKKEEITLQVRVWDSFKGAMIYTDLYSYVSFDSNGTVNHATAIGKRVVMLFSLITDVSGTKIFDGDILLDRAYDKQAPNGKYYESYLPVFFENGAFWVDESFEKDKSTSCLLAEWEKPQVVGNIYQHAHLLNTQY